jgi:hypothetical protein
MNRHRFVRRLSIAVSLACLTFFARSAPAADRRVEAAAQAALKKAATDYRSKHYAAAATRLEKASRACGNDKCSAGTRAALLRDLGTMQFRQGDTDTASKTFADAIALDADLTLNRHYATPDLQAAWDAAKGGGNSSSSGASKGGSPTDETSPPEATPPPAPAPEPESNPSPPPPVEAEVEKPNAAPRYEHLWIGVAGALDFVLMPSGDDLCKLTPKAFPANSLNAYCTNPDGTDFPTHLTSAQNRALVSGAAGNIAGGLQPGDIRAMLSVDYALSPSFLLGVRIGYIFNAYPGSAAVNDARAFGRDVHGELRATYLFGQAPLAEVGFAPMAFVGGGVSEFDGHVTTAVTLSSAVGERRVNVWVTDGPMFATLGFGFRYQFSLRAAFTAAVRANAAFPWNGVLPTAGPEIGFQYGF